MTSQNVFITIQPNPEVLLAYADKDYTFTLTYKELRGFWDYATAEDIEYINAYTQDALLLCNLWTASGQGGIVVVVDISAGRIVHVSEGAFAATSIVYSGAVISLCNISHWGVSPHLALASSVFGTLDALTESSTIPCEEISSFELTDPKKLFMSIGQGILTYGYDDKTASVDIDAFLKTTDMGGAQ